MNAHEYEIGLEKAQLDTPALLMDLSVVERNIRTMADFCRGAGVHLRPHGKVHKATPALAWAQIRAGAIGITVAKLSEAEVLASAGVRSILIANQIVGETKIRRLVNLAAHTEVIVAVDSSQNVRELAGAAADRGVRIGILVEVDIGNDRCGALPGEESLQLAELVGSFKSLRFRGLMGYDGHLARVEDPETRHNESLACYKILAETRRFLEAKGLEIEIVSGGGTATYRAAAETGGITELQAGSYLVSDTRYLALGHSEFDRSLTLLATVISTPRKGRPEPLGILDVGTKAMTAPFGFPKVKSTPELEVYSMPQEHARLRLVSGSRDLNVGDKIELWVGDANGTINLHDKIYGMRDGRVETVLNLIGRGTIT
jgi:D-serine deaminase-like pyridoxal phosphate-dependent protein